MIERDTNWVYWLHKRAIAKVRRRFYSTPILIPSNLSAGILDKQNSSAAHAIIVMLNKLSSPALPSPAFISSNKLVPPSHTLSSIRCIPSSAVKSASSSILFRGTTTYVGSRPAKRKKQYWTSIHGMQHKQVRDWVLVELAERGSEKPASILRNKAFLSYCKARPKVFKPRLPREA